MDHRHSMKILILTMNDHETDVKEIVEGAPTPVIFFDSSIDFYQ
jgi:hypothetical protein